MFSDKFLKERQFRLESSTVTQMHVIVPFMTVNKSHLPRAIHLMLRQAFITGQKNGFPPVFLHSVSIKPKVIVSDLGA